MTGRCNGDYEILANRLIVDPSDMVENALLHICAIARGKMGRFTPVMINILVIDVGTSSMRGTLFSQHGKPLTMVRVAYCSQYPGRGLVEQDPVSWKQALIRITAEIMQWASAHGCLINTISLTAQRSSAIPVDRTGTPLHNAIMWQDKRTSYICRALGEQAAEIFLRTGLRLSPVMAAPKFAWFKQQRPDIYHRAHKLLVIADYLLFLMTGKFQTDHTYGSRTLLMDLKTRQWDPEMLQLFDLDEELLCASVNPGSIAGETTDVFQSRTGIPAGTPVVSAGGDQQCSALGAGVIDGDSIQVTSGTGSFIIAAVDQPVFDPQMRVLCSASAIPGKFILESSILAASSFYSWIANSFYQTAEIGSSLHTLLGKDAAASPVGANGVLALPYLQGRGAPDWNASATGSLLNITLTTNRGDLVRAALEGIAAEIAENLDIILQHTEVPDRIVLSGGLTHLELFNQIQADMYDRAVCLPNNRETTSLGAWISAAVALGLHRSYADAFATASAESTLRVFSPVPENVIVYRTLQYEKKRLYRTLVDGGIYPRHCDSSSDQTRTQ